MYVRAQPVGSVIAFMHLSLKVGWNPADEATGKTQMFTESTGVREETVAEERIWQAVIVSTIEEWMSGPLRRSLEAEKFLFRDESDFRLVCESAGMDAGRLRQQLIRLREKLPTRPEASPRN